MKNPLNKLISILLCMTLFFGIMPNIAASAHDDSEIIASIDAKGQETHYEHDRMGSKREI